MKKNLIVFILLLAFSVTAVLIGCSSKPTPQSPAPQPNPTPSTTNNATGSTANKTITVDELKTYNGQNGKAAYVAVSGTVYDVTNARKWKNGSHVQGVVAGTDLTSAMGESPHGDDVLKDVPVVGTLK